VQRALIDRRVRLLSSLGGDVLDLSQPSARSAVLDAARDGAPSRRYDLVVSVAELIRIPDLAMALSGIERMLTPEGELLVIEPVHHPGTSATIFASFWLAHPAIAGTHVERDVARAVRSVGLVLTDLERFTMPTTVWPLRLFIQARARRSFEQVAA
jgi:hypothetical protein